MSLELMYITNDTNVATIAQECGVDRVWIDLEYLGKELRQGCMDTVKSKHSIEDVKALRGILTTSKLQVRVNPINPNSKQEIEKVIEYGADIIMLPYFKTKQEVETFINLVDGRAKVNLLFETADAVENADEILSLRGIDEVHIGLNDLHLCYGMKFMFELLANGTVDALCEKFKKAGIRYGFGGIAKLGTGLIPARIVIAEHYRLGSSAAILSRSFCNVNNCDMDQIKTIFKNDLNEVRNYEKSLLEKDTEFFESNRKLLQEKVRQIVGR